MLPPKLFAKKPLSMAIALLSTGLILSTTGCSSSSNAADNTTTTTKSIVSVEFTSTPAPTQPTEMLKSTTSSVVDVTFSDGSTATYPLAYKALFYTKDSIGSNEAGRLYDVNGSPLSDLNGDPVIAETPDSNSLLTVGGKHYLVTHYEYDWMLGNGDIGYLVPDWYSRMPMSMTLTDIRQDATSGELTATAQKPIDFSGVNGLWIPCFGSQTPWNTHLGSEEDYDLYFTTTTNGSYGSSTAAGVDALTNLYFNNAKTANPYHYGFPPEVIVAADGNTSVVKHYSMGRATWEMSIVMPDSRTAYYGDDGSYVGLFMYVADTAAQLTAGTLYAAKWTQTSAANGGAADLSWIKLGHATDAEVKAIIDAGTTFWDIFDSVDPAVVTDWAAQGYKQIRAGDKNYEYIKLKSGQEQAAAFLESRRYAAYLGATTEFNKMEGVAVNRADKQLYIAMSYMQKGMLDETGEPRDDIHLPNLTAGATFQVNMAAGQQDTSGNAINSDWVGTAMHVPTELLGEDLAATDALGNTANPEKVANPDNVFFAENMRTLFIGEDSGTHVNNFVWAYNVDTRKLSRILSLPSGSEATGLQVVEDLNGFSYIMSNNQHQGEWIKTIPTQLQADLEAEAEALYGRNAKGVLNYYLDAKVGYLMAEVPKP